MHVDFFTLHGQNYLLLVDSHSKWLEVERMTKTKAYHIIQVLRRRFVRFGVPFQLVSDNAPQFVALEFWMPGVIARNVARRTYIVNIGNRDVKRHIDDIRLFRGGETGANFENNDAIDESWMYGSYGT